MVMSFGSMGISNYSSGNVYETMKSRYGCGYHDYEERPRVAGYPMDIIPKAPDPVIQRSWLGRLYDKLYG